MSHPNINGINIVVSDNGEVSVVLAKNRLEDYIATIFWSAAALINIGQSVARLPQENEGSATYQVGRFAALASLGTHILMLYQLVQADRDNTEQELLSSEQRTMIGQIFLAAYKCTEAAISILQHGDLKDRILEIQASPLGRLDLREIAATLGVPG